MSKFFQQLGGFKSHTIAREIGIHFTNVYHLIKKGDPRIGKAIQSLRSKGVKPDMVRETSFSGLDPEVIAKESGFCRATVYNFKAGKTSPETTEKIQETIDKLKIEKEHELQRAELETIPNQ